ncbi:hypothetical protein NEOLEDRAFT_1142685, partial [Neolentinus lepideus HHB14362 ss-1]
MQVLPPTAMLRRFMCILPVVLISTLNGELTFLIHGWSLTPLDSTKTGSMVFPLTGTSDWL